MDDSSNAPMFHSLHEFAASSVAMANEFADLFSSFRPSSTLSYSFVFSVFRRHEGLRVSKEEHLSRVVEDLSSKTILLSKEQGQQNVDYSHILQQLSLSPDQQLVLKAIEQNAPMMWNDVVAQLQWA